MTGQAELIRASKLRAVLYVALVLSALVAFFGVEAIQAEIQEHRLAPEWSLAPAGVFSLTLVLYALDRALLVRVRRLPSGRAFFQLAFGLALLTLLLPGGWRDYQSGREQLLAADHVEALMHHPDARVRAVAAELAGFRGGPGYQRRLAELAQDPSSMVRQAAQDAQARLRTGSSPLEAP